MAAYVTLVTVGILMLVDAYLWASKRETVSEMIWRTSKKHPLIPFAVGFAMGHLFFR